VIRESPRIAVVILALASAVRLAGFQQPTFRAGVEVVTIDVHVTRGGTPVSALTLQDFALTDNGVAQQITDVMYEHVPLEAFLVLDTSGSMLGEPLERLKRASGAFLAGLAKGDRATLLTFSHYIAQRQALTDDIRSIGAALNNIEAHGSTSLHDAIFAMLRLRVRNQFRPVALVFSDGLDNMSWLTAGQVIEAARRSDVVVHSVSTVPDQIRGRRTGEGQPQNALLRDLAENTGGRLWEASSRQLTETFVKVLEDIRTRYVLTYSPTGVATGGWHAVQVKLTRGRGDIRARPGYFATPRK
jgi:Ca-activated chloride channel family protein